MRVVFLALAFWLLLLVLIVAVATSVSHAGAQVDQDAVRQHDELRPPIAS